MREDQPTRRNGNCRDRARTDNELTRYVSMMCSLLVSPGLVMLGRFPVMACGMRQMF